MSSHTAAPTFYTWNPPERPVSVQLPFNVVDRILLDVMRGFGAVPKRGAEIGGLLLGNVRAAGDSFTVQIEDFLPIDCGHASGPSYILSEQEKARFGEEVGRWAPAPSKSMYAVGYYRSHTRDGLHLAPEDLQILDNFLPAPTAIALMIKPYATRVSVAGIFFREAGKFKADKPYLEFPFRRKELGGGSSGVEKLASAARFGQAPRREDTSASSAPGSQRLGSLPAPRSRPDIEALFSRSPRASSGTSAVNSSQQAAPAEIPSPTFATLGSSRKTAEPGGRGWVWAVVSCLCLILGGGIGFQVAQSRMPVVTAPTWQDAWDIGLAVKKADSELQVTWNSYCPAIRDASGATLIIRSTREERTIKLSPAQLRTGNLVYKTVPERVTFRLETTPRANVVVSQTVEYGSKTELPKP